MSGHRKDERLQTPGRIVSGQARSGSRASNRSGRALALCDFPIHSRLASTDACPAFVLARRRDASLRYKAGRGA